jgi:hypothetical protein
MTVIFKFKRLARSLGIVAIFAIIGPLSVTAVFALFLLTVGVPMLQLMLAFVDLESLRGWLSIAVFLLIFFSLVATVTPSIIAGVAFAIASVYCGMNSLWVALAIVGCMVLFVVALGFFLSPSESSPMLVPSVKGLRQGAFLALFLSVPAAIAATLCWLFSRPLHRLP